MNTPKKVRSVASSVLSLVLALPIFGGTVAIPPVLAAAAPTQTLVINEVNWAGSAGKSADQWVELYNASPSSINFKQHPYTLYSGTTAIATIDDGLLLPDRYFVISHTDTQTAPADTTLSNELSTRPDLVAPALAISRTDLKLTLKDDADAVVDVVGDGTAAFAGSDGTTGEKIVASMSRKIGAADGTLASAWFTPHTIGTGIKDSVTQYGTPARVNVEIAVPTQLVVSPNPANNTPTVEGSVMPEPKETEARFVNVYFTNLDTKAVTHVSDLANGTTYEFSATAPALPVGHYRVTVVAEDTAANPSRSKAVVVPIANSPQNVYVVAPSAPVLSAPVLNTYPAQVSTPTVTLSGTVGAGTAVVVSINGDYYDTAPVAAGQTAFTLPVELNLNQVNVIEVRAKAANGSTSQPAVATITHDNMAPKALDATKVTVKSNKSGIQDTVAGVNGAAEAGSTVEFYGDAALTKLITTVKADANGAFPATNIGDNLYTTVYARVRDAAGNASSAVSLSNPVPFAEQPITISVSVNSITQSQATIAWQPVAGATKYRVKYKVSGGSYSSPMEVCVVGACANASILSNLAASTNYVVAIAAVDASGSESNYTEVGFKTLAPVKVTTTSSNGTNYNGVGGNPTSGTGTTGGTVKKPAATPTPTATVTPTPTASATPENGEVKSESTESRNWTPWIILAILVALAIIATAGYFYWFGGEDENNTPAPAGKAPNGGDAAKSEEVTTKVTKKGDGQNKRW